jgi:hypothetical protein
MATSALSSTNTSHSWYGIQPSVSTVDTFAGSICLLDHVIFLAATCSKGMWRVRGIRPTMRDADEMPSPLGCPRMILENHRKLLVLYPFHCITIFSYIFL